MNLVASPGAVGSRREARSSHGMLSDGLLLLLQLLRRLLLLRLLLL